MNSEDNNFIGYYESELVKIVKVYLLNPDVSHMPRMHENINNMLTKVFIENKFMTAPPEVKISLPDPKKPKQVRVDLINPKTGEVMDKHQFIDYCHWTALKD